MTTAALAPAVLLASPAFADSNQAAASTTNPPAPTAPDREAADASGKDQAEQDRKTILAIIADPMASEYMKEAGHKAIADGPAAMRTFIETDQHSIRLDDYRIAIMRLLHSAGPHLEEGIKAFLKTDGRTLADLRHFYEVTQHELRDTDNRIEIARLVNDAGPALKEAAKKALLGTPADRIAFLEKGRHLAQAEDDRVELARIDEGWDGPILSEAISKLLNGSPTPAELRHFLEVTQHELRDQDNRVEIAQIIDGGGPELVKAGRAALAGTPADRAAFLLTGQHEARKKDEKAQQEKDENDDKKDDKNDGQKDQDGSGADTGNDDKKDTGSTGNTAVTPQSGSGAQLASTGAGDTPLIAGGAGTALVAGAGLLLAARIRRQASGN
ncbi:ALF repeat-containing protein [Streptomyces sp. C11-1]|uniref:ALF repeat-containing protein n=1 Tax=Streptomyces durocortorensis TaxID=2811104 RepID=A0ABY9W3V0_9ACTN|nr:ALF repeat-containing protein [Streptomyces durocortorensis]WNF27976.1 ALF repeat-containing protein [Streptomyces durocortorensis]